MILIDSENCYEGFNTKHGFFEIDTYSNLYDNPDIDKGSIEFSLSYWSDEQISYKEFLKKMADQYEKRYGAPITHIGYIGSIGRWNGSFIGGKITDSFELSDIIADDIDYTSLNIDSDGKLYIKLTHHDSSHYLYIYLLTKNKFKLFTPHLLSDHTEFDTHDLETLKSNTAPIKYNRIVKSHFGVNFEREVK